jgi:hypothetical protein
MLCINLHTKVNTMCNQRHNFVNDTFLIREKPDSFSGIIFKHIVSNEKITLHISAHPGNDLGNRVFHLQYRIFNTYTSVTCRGFRYHKAN